MLQLSTGMRTHAHNCIWSRQTEVQLSMDFTSDNKLASCFASATLANIIYELSSIFFPVINQLTQHVY